ncbi:MAG: metallophosphoesterase [Opitutaceae bacterium]|nr:metallophosphoesterase [Opitutaceae bacterium]
MKGRIIAIGDIHGCHLEFAELLEKLSPTADDQIILLGDLVNRGPEPCKVIDLARKCGAISLLGNHEARLLNYRRTQNPDLLKETDEATVKLLREEDWAYLAKMPLTHYVEELNIVFVHGGFVPDVPWQKQPAEIVTRIQVIDRDGRPRKRGEAPNAPPWADLWVGPPFVVYGHTSRPEIYKLKWSVCIDTACAMGGYLTAYVLPEKRFVQVKAKRRYYP